MRPTLLVIPLLLAAVSGCGGTNGGAGGDAGGDAGAGETPTAQGATPTGAPAPGAAFQARPVLAVQGERPDGVEAALVRRLERLDCLRRAPTTNGPAAEPMLACDLLGAGFLLGPTEVDGGVAGVEVVELQRGYAVQVGLDPAATDAMAGLTSGLVGSEGRFAVVVDGALVALPRVADGIGSTLQIGEAWTRAEAEDVAARLTS
ncbi:preprotein translocase subunit SecD [Nocardioides dokdonensis FR1436]|uniref:Preprotein translocase subunit SecD n=1 Tax=Nocardioides dokdonensis FR1436 TaxID=1300347 RepID=A0A1A9GGN2_9ACTN|nr:hypothetical protein [Nocardioides dokdonensis]ANH37394.1 preprotein translocase subunit SecD [Nocardioides dokdonensis FR1436]